jgi:hypothetical protein
MVLPGAFWLRIRLGFSFISYQQSPEGKTFMSLPLMYAWHLPMNHGLNTGGLGCLTIGEATSQAVAIMNPWNARGMISQRRPGTPNLNAQPSE